MAWSRARWRPATTLVLLAALAASVVAHEHHHDGESKIEDGQTVSQEPVDSILWIHIFVQTAAFGIIFPLGMVFGMVKSRWHVPTQVLGAALAAVGYALGHMHGGREFVSSNVHANFAPILNLTLVAQVFIGIYLKLHLEKGLHGRIRRIVRLVHSIIGKSMPVLAWTQMLFGGITTLGFCQGDDYLGQCLAHFIMGSAFIAYAVIMTILLLVGQLWLRRTGRSQEFFDSVVIAVWGCVNTFTEHRWGTAWVRNDWQHTTMGIIWWAAGLVGVWLSRDRDGRPHRNFIPAFVLIITGWGMSAHPQELMVSAAVHRMFGYTLMAAGLSRLIEISFIVKDKVGVAEDGRTINSWQYVPIYLLFSSGFLFMGASHEQMDLVANSDMDHVSYILILYSISAIMFLLVHVLVSAYDRCTSTAAAPPPIGFEITRGVPLRDAEEFELEGLVSDEENEGEGLMKKQRQKVSSDDDSSSPSTLGRNADVVAR